MRRRQSEHTGTMGVHLCKLGEVSVKQATKQCCREIICSDVLNSRAERKMLSSSWRSSMIQSFRRRKERLPDVQVSSSLYRPSGAVSGLQVAAQTTENADKHSCSPPTP